MDREILFRGKRKTDGKWLYGNLLRTDDDGTCIIQNHVPHHLLKNYEVDPETVCQYTGLTDKDGRKIFWGDIVKGVAYSSDFVGVIVWIKEIAGFGVRYFNLHREPTAWENSSILKAIQAGRKDQFAAKVIGNIFDNTDLLEGGAK